MQQPSSRGAVLLEAALLLALAGTIAGLSQLQHTIAENEAGRQMASIPQAQTTNLAVQATAANKAPETPQKKEQICGEGSGEQMKGYEYTHTVRVVKGSSSVNIDRASKSYGRTLTDQNKPSTCIIKYCPVEGDTSGCVTLKKVTAGEAYQDPENVEDVVTQTAASTDGKTNFEKVKNSFGLSDQQLSEMLADESKSIDAQIAVEKSKQTQLQSQLDYLEGVLSSNEKTMQQNQLREQLAATQRNISSLQTQNANLKTNVSSLANPLNPTQSINQTAQNSWANQAGQQIAQTPPLAGSYSGQGGGANTPAENGPGPGMGGGGTTQVPGQPTVTPVYGPASPGGGGMMGGIGQAIGQALGGLLGGIMGGGGGGGGNSSNSANPCAQWAGTALSQSSQRCECPSGKTWNGSACAVVDTSDPASTQLSAELSCAPAVQEIGKPISLSWTCRNANTSGQASVGTGFATNGAASGTMSDLTATSTATTTVSKMNFGLTCKKGSETKQASCELQTVRPFLILVAVPSVVTSGATANVAWVSGGMRNTNDGCTLRSSTDATFIKQGVNGVAESHAIATTTVFTARCTSAAGYSHESAITVSLK